MTTRHIAESPRRRLGTRLYAILLHVAGSRPQSRRQHRWSMMKEFLAEESR